MSVDEVNEQVNECWREGIMESQQQVELDS